LGIGTLVHLAREAGWEGECPKEHAGTVASGKPAACGFAGWVADLDEKDLSMDFLLKPIFVRGAVVQVLGEWGSGKSLAAIDLACRVSLGWEWHGEKATPADVLYVASEALYSAKRRFIAWKKKHGAEPRVYLTPRVDLSDAKQFNAWKERLSATAQFGLVIVDTLRASTSGDENDSGDMQQALNALRELADDWNACVVFLHHPAKGEAGRTGRGSGAIEGAVDNTVIVEKHAGQGLPYHSIGTKGGKWRSFELPTKHYKVESVGVGPQTEPEGVVTELSPAELGAARVKEKGLTVADLLPGLVGKTKEQIVARVAEEFEYSSLRKAGDVVRKAAARHGYQFREGALVGP
jgi:hypothetical protein